ncbi:MAG: dolichyl-P-Man:Man(5)GlcNAc(2)-PP-dolichol alpha-1,3-mannosyltransferase [Thelocarpon superellum]|nr:MAG: dolichyl-P-Man:Man(5)GlcNAc(2)-PP-dolichol alpha-1,3-mannosyltransferase [Thelocarpon superellum]
MNMDPVKLVVDLSTNPRHLRWLCPLLIVADAALCAVIIRKVPYTEIDWRAYMEQIELYLAGERHYQKIVGGTGPLVYPAAHVYIYRGLYALTDQGRDIVTGQIIFAGLYLATLALVMACYRLAKAPPYVFPLLVLSKRLHSIYVLRLFNDCFAVGALFLAIYAYQRRWWTLGSIVYSWSLGIKMSVLLVLPAIAAVVYQGILIGQVIDRALSQVVLILGTQVLIGLPFLQVDAGGYLSRAFEFTRQFLFKWTVNWRFVGEERFTSRRFSIALLAAHVALLLLFLTTRWLRPSERSVVENFVMVFRPPPATVVRAISKQVTPRFTLTTILTCNAIGMLCARSLHYQFYSWLAWSTPFLLWRTGLHPILQYAIWAAQEWAWNVFPSTDVSSKVVVTILALMVGGVWFGTRNDYVVPLDQAPSPGDAHAHEE